LEPISDVLWQDYAANRASAMFGQELTAIYEEAVTFVLPVARERADEAIRAYWRHADLHRVMRRRADFYVSR
jgi:histone H3/H4